MAETMTLRNKIILVQGQRRIAQLIATECDRIDADRIILITALRFPEFLPVSLTAVNPNQILDNVIDVLTNFSRLDHDFLISAEYANAVMDRDKNILAVDGESMNTSWFYQTIRSIHKSLGQIIVEVRTEQEQIFVNDVAHPWEEGLELLRH